MKTLKRVTWALAFAAMLFIVGCEGADRATGTNTANGTADPNGGTAGEVIRAVDAFLPPGLNLFTKLALLALTGYQQVRLATTSKQRDAATAAQAATITGVKTATANDPTLAAKIADAIYDAHQSAGVDPTHTVDSVNTLEPPK